MITIARLTKRYEALTVLQDVSVRFAKGHVIALVGPSGGGKSTLLRCINGLEEFQAGEVRVDDVTLGAGRCTRGALLAVRQRVGFVFQHFNLFAHRTALGNVIEAPVHVRKLPLAEATLRGEALLERVGMIHRRAAYPHELSGGEQQRVAIARALAMEPGALLLDEPTSALDPSLRAEVLAVLAKLAAEGTTMIIVTHEMSFARDVADRVVVLDNGRIQEDGSPREILKD